MCWCCVIYCETLLCPLLIGQINWNTRLVSAADINFNCLWYKKYTGICLTHRSTWCREDDVKQNVTLITCHCFARITREKSTGVPIEELISACYFILYLCLPAKPRPTNPKIQPNGKYHFATTQYGYNGNTNVGWDGVAMRAWETIICEIVLSFQSVTVVGPATIDFLRDVCLVVSRHHKVFLLSSTSKYKLK